ncbi:MAG: hypothetical protein BAJALOKI1v1_150013 [Promethearchaeota archaeon]|nr:MAG: hypothetical protein BAJALOKI1v1_150013 [Candidatus Lokiarchaeota archaeon]
MLKLCSLLQDLAVFVVGAANSIKRFNLHVEAMFFATLSKC